MKNTIYIADDEKNICDLIKDFLENDGYEVTAFSTGDALFEHFMEKPCDLVILDIMMPGTDGLTLCEKLRKITSVPIIILTAKDTEFDYVRGITMGSDDYLVKPFKPTMLLMRVHSLLRRVEMDSLNNVGAGVEDKDVEFGDLIYSATKNEITCKGEAVAFTQTELKVLGYMLERNDKNISRDELLKAIWGYDAEVETRVTDETLRRIRKKLTTCRSNVLIQTVWGYGYKLGIVSNK